jgi:hypothetical protein
MQWDPSPCLHVYHDKAYLPISFFLFFSFRFSDKTIAFSLIWDIRSNFNVVLGRSSLNSTILFLFLFFSFPFQILVRILINYPFVLMSAKDEG